MGERYCHGPRTGRRECGDLAYTTVMTTLDRLFKKAFLTRSEEGRAFRYTPRFSRDQLRREAAGHVLKQLLDSSPASSVPLSFLVEMLSERDAQLLDDLGKLVDASAANWRNENRVRRRESNVCCARHAVSFAIFFILYSSLSVLVCVLWRRVWHYGQQR